MNEFNSRRVRMSFQGSSPRWRAAAAGVVLASLLPSLASADESEEESAGPTIDVTVPKPEPPQTREFHTHDGLSLRAGVGLGLFSAEYRLGAAEDAELDTGGVDTTFDLQLGYAATPSLTLGLTGALSTQLTGDWEAAGQEVRSGDLTTAFVGPFVDGYLSPQGGVHFGGSVGLAQLRPDLPDADNVVGFGGTVWAGRDFWVAPNWSLGTSLRAGWMRARDSDDDLTATRLSLGLVFSVTYQ